MAWWIESHQELGRHPKTRKLARLLSTSIPTVVGHLHFFWWWALDFAQDGDLSRFEAQEVADAALWDGDANEFYCALVTAGFVDEGGETRTIHDWDDYAGKIIDRRKANAEKQRQWRDRQRENTLPSRNGYVTGTSPARNGATKPNLTEPNLTSTGKSGGKSTPRSRSRADVVEKVFAPESEPIQLAAYLRDHILAHKPDARDAKAARDERRLQNWAQVFDLMVRVDGRSPDRVRKVIDFATSDSFWRPNILSPGKLRDKFDQLDSRMAATVSAKSNGHRLSEPDRPVLSASNYALPPDVWQ